MKLAASLIVRNELARYLEPCIDHLLEFCDEIRALNDSSTDGSDEWLVGRSDRIVVADLAETSFFKHEGAARQVLLDWTLAGNPTHVLAIDADEFVSDGPALRRLLDQHRGPYAWSLTMEEIWEATPDCLCVRGDGGWRPHEATVLWATQRLRGPARIRDRALACGRIPTAVNASRTTRTGLSLLHFGWANEADRGARHDRYVQADNGRFHARHHLDSIMWPCDRVDLDGRDWPPPLERYRDRICDRAEVAA